MKVPVTYQCDVCRKSRADDSNHWFVVHVEGGTLGITHWKECLEADIDDATFHFCGLEHLLRKLSELLNPPQPDITPEEKQ